MEMLEAFAERLFWARVHAANDACASGDPHPGIPARDGPVDDLLFTVSTVGLLLTPLAAAVGLY